MSRCALSSNREKGIYDAESIIILHVILGLNEAREKTEAIIRISRARQPGRKLMRKGIGKQLGYVKRNLQSISTLAREGHLAQLTPARYRQVLIINELYRQQTQMHINKIHRISERIAIEGKFGQGKRRFGLSRIMAKLAATSETMIVLNSW